LLEAETSNLGQVIENRTITQMPLNGRNYQHLAVLSAGVLPSRVQNFVEDAFSANGASHDNPDHRLHDSPAARGRRRRVPAVDPFRERSAPASASQTCSPWRATTDSADATV